MVKGDDSEKSPKADFGKESDPLQYGVSEKECNVVDPKCEDAQEKSDDKDCADHMFDKARVNPDNQSRTNFYKKSWDEDKRSRDATAFHVSVDDAVVDVVDLFLDVVIEFSNLR